MRRVLLVAPCAAGKTVIFSDIISQYREKKRGLAMVIVHRRELVDQAVEKLARFGIKAGVIMGDDARADWRLPVQVASIQTLAARKDKLPAADLIIVDEAHHCLANVWQEVLQKYEKSKVIGFTATPFRTDKIGLGDFFEDITIVASPKQLMEWGYTVDYDAFEYLTPELANIKIRGGDFAVDELEERSDTPALIGNIVDEWMQHAAGRRTVCFPVTIQHSEHIVAEFIARGVSAAHLDYRTPKKRRKAILAGLRSGEILVVSSIAVISEGFDEPSAEVAILARAFGSLVDYLQSTGRVLRTSPKTGKTRALIHDHGENIRRHGLYEQERDYSLQPTEQKVAEMHLCLNCHKVSSSWKPDGTCPYCGDLQHMPMERDEKDPIIRGRRQEIEVVPGIRVSVKEIDKIKESFQLKGIDRQLTSLDAAKISIATRQQKVAELLRLQAIQRRDNLQPGFPAQAFRATFGCWPKFKDEELRGVQPAEKPFLPYRRKI